ncbi:hypothetical protein, partial [Ralstonia solanacearum]|uniref:hypothetical protein n=1 Tax=Ralstonia solanacearum TaxID=305 RepID=UPI0018D04AC0
DTQLRQPHDVREELGRRSTEQGGLTSSAMGFVEQGQGQGLKKLRKVDIGTSAAETQRNQILNSLESRTATVASNLTEYQRALVPDSLTRFEGSPDRQINNVLRNAETVAGEWKNIRSTVKEAIGG